MSRETNDSSSKALARLEQDHIAQLRTIIQATYEKGEAGEKKLSLAQVQEMCRYQEAILEHPVISDGEKEQARDILKILEPKSAQVKKECDELSSWGAKTRQPGVDPSSLSATSAGRPNIKLGVRRRPPGVDPSSLPVTAAGSLNSKLGAGRRQPGINFYS